MTREQMCKNTNWQPPDALIGSQERRVDREHVARGRPEPAREDARATRKRQKSMKSTQQYENVRESMNKIISRMNKYEQVRTY